MAVGLWEKLREVFGAKPTIGKPSPARKRLSRRFSDEDLNDIYDKNGGYCWHCNKRLSFNNYGRIGAKGAWEVDHSRPTSRGGSDSYRNWVPSCIPCNRSKGDLRTDEFS